MIRVAGAGTIFELAAFGCAAILIPYPHAYAHQKLNAEYAAKLDAVCVIDENELDAEALWRQMSELKRDQNRRDLFLRTIDRPERIDR